MLIVTIVGGSDATVFKQLVLQSTGWSIRMLVTLLRLVSKSKGRESLGDLLKWKSFVFS